MLAAVLVAVPAQAADPGFVGDCLRQEGGRLAAPCRSLRAAFEFLRRDHVPPVDDGALVAAAADAAESLARRRPAAPATELAEAALAAMLAAADPAAEHIRAGTPGRSVVSGVPGLALTVRGDGSVAVLAALDDGPAAAAGLRPGDVIEALDGAPFAAASRAEAERRLAGPPGSRLALELRRGEERLSVVLTRAPERAAAVTARPLGEAVLLRLPGFGAGTLQAVRGAMAAHPAAAAWILDLRGAALGPTDQAMAVADLFMAQGTIATLRRRNAEPRRFAAQSHDDSAGRPLAVLVDAGTAGAAEVLAAALQDSGRAVVVGQPSFGDARDYSVLPLPDGGGIRIATGRWIRPAGTVLERVRPDVAVSGDPLPAALSALRGW